MNLERIPAVIGRYVNVIVETPLGSSIKYAYDPEANCMRVKHHLPLGYYFPFNFGFIPSTQAEDGDPIDAVLYGKEPLLSGAIVECRLIGALLAQQKEKQRIIRNDRLLVIPTALKIHDSITGIKEIDRNELQQVQNFFVTYEMYRNIEFKPIKWAGSIEAFKIVKQ